MSRTILLCDRHLSATECARNSLLKGAVVTGLTLGLLVSPVTKIALAETMHNALVSAYNTNPRLDAERARQLATDEEVPRARSGFRPTISGSANTGFNSSNTGIRTPGGVVGSTNDGFTYPKGYALSLAQSIFAGFRTLNSVREAEAAVEAGREDLRVIEQTTLLNAATAYMDVIRDQAIVRLRENNVRVLSKDLSAAKDRFDVGEVTKTDVAQARARRAGAVSTLDLAKANLRTSRATYEQVVGHPPSRLRAPRNIMHLMPGTLTEAINIGDAEHPTIMAAAFREIVARHAIDRIRGELLPEVNLEASYSRNWDTSRLTHDTETTTVTGRVTVPFYRGGEVSARVRQAKHTRDQRRREVDLASTQVKSGVVAAWSRLQAARAQIRSDRTQVEANRVALAGVREEEKVGQRTVLEVLNAEQELLNSQVSLETTRRDLTVAHYALLAAIGRLTVVRLGLLTAQYDPTQHLDTVRHNWFGLSIEHEGGLTERFQALRDAPYSQGNNDSQLK